MILVPQLQEINDLPCDRGSDRSTLESTPKYTTEIQGGRLDFSPLTPDWNKKRGIYEATPDALWARAQWVRQYIRSREENTVVVVAHGNFLRYIVGLDGYYDRVRVSAIDVGSDHAMCPHHRSLDLVQCRGTIVHI